MFVEKLKLRPELLKAHDLLTHFAGDLWRVLPLFNFAEDVEIVVVQGQKAGIFRMLLVGLVWRAVNHSELLTHENSVQIAVDGCPDAIF